MLSHIDPSLRIDTKRTELASANPEKKNEAIMVFLVKCLEVSGRQRITIKVKATYI